MKIIRFTKEGYEVIQKEQVDLLEQRKAAVEDLSKARAMGDLSENGYYKAAKFKLGGIDRRLRELAYQLRYGKIIEKSMSDTIQIGSRVVVQADGQQLTYSIVGDYEADPLNYKISSTSPLGKLLVGRKAGDTVTLHAPKGEVHYVVKNVE